MLKLLAGLLGTNPEARPYINYSEAELLQIITEDAMNDEFNTLASREYDLRRANVNKVCDGVKEGVQ